MRPPIKVEIEPELGPDGKLTAECIAKAKAEMRAKMDGEGNLSAQARDQAERALETMLQVGRTPAELVENNRHQAKELLEACLARLAELPDAIQSMAMLSGKAAHIFELGRVSGFVNTAGAIIATAIEQLDELHGCGCKKKPEAKKEDAS